MMETKGSSVMMPVFSVGKKRENKCIVAQEIFSRQILQKPVINYKDEDVFRGIVLRVCTV